MESKLFDELEGKEISVTVFQGGPLKCKLISQDDNFIKVEKIDRKMTHKISIINKSLISTITIK